MLDQVAEAFDRQDYRTAAQLLQVLMKESPQDVWVQFYGGRLQEVSGQLEKAEQTYRQILKKTTNVRLTGYLRQGIERVQMIEREQRQRAIAQATTDPLNLEVGCLILEPLDQETRSKVAPSFARLMRLDNYIARLHLPSRGWRLYRTGSIGEMKVYVEELNNLGIPAFCLSLSEIEAVQVFQVEQMQIQATEGTATCRNVTDQLGTFTFQWSEVSLQVEGLLPIFESVVDEGAWRKIIRKEKTQDYAHLLDLHFQKRRCILRLCDRTYQFYPEKEATTLSDRQSRWQTTNRINWNHLVTTLRENLQGVEIWSGGFSHFAETAFDQDLFLKRIPPHIDLFRRDQTIWDSAFQLYSTLALIRGGKLNS